LRTQALSAALALPVLSVPPAINEDFDANAR
jgi:hypothetical protein